MVASQLKIDPSPVSDEAAEHLRRMLDVEPRPRRMAIAPVLITLIALAIAALLSWAMWHVYMQGTWTRDGTVRVYVDRLAPEVAGRIVALPAHDNEYVHKGDLLMQIDPTDYKIDVTLAQAAVLQDRETLANLRREAVRRQDLSGLAVTVEAQQSAETAALVEAEIGRAHV